MKLIKNRQVLSKLLVFAMTFTAVGYCFSNPLNAAANKKDDPLPPGPQTTHKITTRVIFKSKQDNQLATHNIPSEIKDGESINIELKIARLFSVARVLVNGKVVSEGPRFTLKKVKKDTRVDILLKRKKIKLMIDPGHAKWENRSPINKSYYESVQMWKLHLPLIARLKKIPNIEVHTTRRSLTSDVGVVERGLMSRGCNLFLSLHSNYTPGGFADYPVALTATMPYNKPISEALGWRMGDTVRDTIRTKQPNRIWGRKNDAGTDWFGVIRGSAAVGTPGLLMEHSFHSNRRVTEWLLKDHNLKKLGTREADDIGVMYGFIKGSKNLRPKNVENLNAKRHGNKVSLKWAYAPYASGYDIYRWDNKTKKYKYVTWTLKNTYTDKHPQSKKCQYKIVSFRQMEHKRFVFSKGSVAVARKGAALDVISELDLKLLTKEYIRAKFSAECMSDIKDVSGLNPKFR